MEFVLIPAGSFRFGSPPDEPARQADETLHEVVIDAAFYLGKYEVTQAEWARVMHRNPSRFTACGPRCPVETVSYDDIRLFIRRLTEIGRGGRFRLPTEAEWEYACRAGSLGSWYFGADSCRCGLRYTHSPADKGFSLGFRLLREVDVAVAAATRHSAAPRHSAALLRT